MSGKRNHALHGIGLLPFFRGLGSRGLVADVFEHLAGALVGRRVLDGEDDIFVVEVFGPEEEDVRTALVLRVVAVFPVEAASPFFALGGFLVFLGLALGVFDGVLAEMASSSLTSFNAAAASFVMNASGSS